MYSEPSPDLSRVNYELNDLDKLVSTDLKTIFVHKSTLTERLYTDFKKSVDEEVARVKESLVTAVHTFHSEKDIERYVQYHQRALMRLVGNFLKYENPQMLMGLSDFLMPEAFLQYSFGKLQELLNFIEKYFKQYFDINAWIPPNYKIIVTHAVHTKNPALKEGLLLQHIDRNLIDISLSPLINFVINNEHTSETYGRVIYLKELQKELLQLAFERESDDVENELMVLLFYLNFNSKAFFNFCINQMLSDCKELSTNAKLEKLEYYLKRIYQTQVKPGFALETDLPPLRDQLIGWITKEIAFVERKSDLTPESLLGRTNKTDDFMFNIGVPTAHFAYLFRVMFETRIFKNRKASEALRFISKRVETENVKHVSPGSFKNDYYVPDLNAIEGVEKLLMKMLDYVKSRRDLK